ncbi:hypothetical protein GQ457_15G020400 [Hibiscus cannabinus]
MAKMIQAKLEPIHEQIDQIEEENEQLTIVCKSHQKWRIQERIDNNLSNIKVSIPPFQGRRDPEAYLMWEKKIEGLFQYNQYSEATKVKLATKFFTDYALTWCHEFSLSMKKFCKPVNTWIELRTILRKRYAPRDYSDSISSSSQRPKRMSDVVSQSREYTQKEKATPNKSNLHPDFRCYRCLGKGHTPNQCPNRGTTMPKCIPRVDVCSKPREVVTFKVREQVNPRKDKSKDAIEVKARDGISLETSERTSTIEKMFSLNKQRVTSLENTREDEQPPKDTHSKNSFEELKERERKNEKETEIEGENEHKIERKSESIRKRGKGNKNSNEEIQGEILKMSVDARGKNNQRLTLFDRDIKCRPLEINIPTDLWEEVQPREIQRPIVTNRDNKWKDIGDSSIGCIDFLSQAWEKLWNQKKFLFSTTHHPPFKEVDRIMKLRHRSSQDSKDLNSILFSHTLALSLSE